MKFAVGPALAALAILPALEASPGRLDTSKRARVSTEERAVLPETRPPERNEVLLDRRFEGPTVERKEAIVGERRSSIAIEEGNEKKLFRTPERKEYEVVERKENAWSGKESRFSTSEDAYRTQVATRFQDKIGEASPLPGNKTPVVSKRTTFDRVNRFAFRRNSDQGVVVNRAGSEEAPRDVSGESTPAISVSGGETPPPEPGSPTLTPFGR